MSWLLSGLVVGSSPFTNAPLDARVDAYKGMTLWQIVETTHKQCTQYYANIYGNQSKFLLFSPIVFEYNSSRHVLHNLFSNLFFNTVRMGLWYTAYRWIIKPLAHQLYKPVHNSIDNQWLQVRLNHVTRLHEQRAGAAAATGEEPIIRNMDANEKEINETAVQIMTSFNEFNASVALPIEFPSLEYTVNMLKSMSSPSSHEHVLVAVSSSGEVLASVCNDLSEVQNTGVIGCGPWSAKWGSVNKGIGRKIITRGLQDGIDSGATSFRLVQTLSNNTSFSLYTSLGFVSREIITLMQGYLRDDVVQAARNSAWTLREMKEADLDEICKLEQSAIGIDRRVTLMDGIVAQCKPVGFWCLENEKKQIIAFTNGFHLCGYAVAVSSAAYYALFAEVQLRMQQLYPGNMPMLHCVARLYPDVQRWLLNGGVKIVRQNNLMVFGAYQEINPQLFYAPSVIY